MRLSIYCTEDTCTNECLLDEICIINCDEECNTCPIRFSCYTVKVDENNCKSLPESAIKEIVRSGRAVRIDVDGRSRPVKLIDKVIVEI